MTADAEAEVEISRADGKVQKFIDRTFGMHEIGVQLPTSTTPTFADSLVVRERLLLATRCRYGPNTPHLSVAPKRGKAACSRAYILGSRVN